MAASSNSRSGGKSEFQPKRLWREKRDISPDRNVVWSEPQNLKLKRVPVLYYLSRNGHLDHPHFMEVPLSSPPALFLKDVIDRLNVLRGKGMASMYSWSCKRSYKNGYVWHDLSENDLIYAAHGHEYILKGSELPERAFLEVASPPPPPPPPPENERGGSSMELEEDKEVVYRVEMEVSTPASESSPDTLGTLMKAESSSGQRCRSSMLMQLISCGSISMLRGSRGGERLLMETTNKREIPSLKRSNSYTADRSRNLELAEKEIERLKAKCIPTKIKAHSSTS
ncbi:hypothetical protein C2S52_017169 [Perilla frutescens var. hirtella]|nr:hypothetical protein C2S52_017169 [Perilla frutescens var. hirtella]